MALTDSKLKHFIYRKLPTVLQNLAVSMSGWRWDRIRYGNGFDTVLSDLLRRDGWSNDEVQEFQLARLLAFVRRAASTVPYYKKKFKELGVDISGVRTLKDYAKLPILTRKEVHEHMGEFQSVGMRKGALLQTFTSGTTAPAISFHQTKESKREQWAVWWRHWLRHGLPLGTWVGAFGRQMHVESSVEKSPFWRVNSFGKTVHFSIYHLSDENLPHYIKEISRRRLPWLLGYPSAISLLAGKMIEIGRTLHQVRWITTSSEKLLNYQREVIEQAFGLNVVDHYGLAEGVANISQCPEGLYHVDEDFAYVEFIPHTELPGLCRIVGTNLSNSASPFLRYDTGDLAVVHDGKCECGLPGRVVSEIFGRQEDVIKFQAGRKIGHLGHLFKGMVNVRESQLVQKGSDQLHLSLVPSSKYSKEDEAKILGRIRTYLGNEMRVEINYVDRIKRSPRGKLRYVISAVQE